ncbi:Sulfite reductase (NADPH) flavoprotein alpha-component [Spironucleus salmonicida]|uniref:Flavodoxin n=1 Tax=Spironucleus salmonicida TaxID=348837 RepID=V6LGY7_9EUKA|nr:Sulfite reductase (NADPH) flavoprotein alpha-component [Spironucleus salmonicida]|eukprot:EST43810.1 Flavodoxin [Spironucleus salmonicida]
MSVSVIYATETGTTEGVANIAKGLLTKAGLKVTLSPADSATPEMFQQSFIYLTSTYNDGEHPAVALIADEFFAAQNSFVSVIKGQKFAVFGLGSTSFENFNAASQMAEECFAKAGGIKIQDTIKCDTDGGDDPEAMVVGFVNNFTAKI